MQVALLGIADIGRRRRGKRIKEQTYWTSARISGPGLPRRRRRLSKER